MKRIKEIFCYYIELIILFFTLFFIISGIALNLVFLYSIGFSLLICIIVYTISVYQRDKDENN